MVSKQQKRRLDKLEKRKKTRPSLKGVVLIVESEESPIVIEGRQYSLNEFHEMFPNEIVIIRGPR